MTASKLLTSTLLILLIVPTSSAFCTDRPTLPLQQVKERAEEIYQASRPASSTEYFDEVVEDEPELAEPPEVLNETASIRFEERFSSQQEVQADFYPLVQTTMPSCGPCRRAKQVMAEEYAAGQIIQIDITTVEGRKQLKDLGIPYPTQVPTWHQFDPLQGTYVSKGSGFSSEAELLGRVGSFGISIERPLAVSQGLSEAYVDADPSLEAVAAALACHIGRNQPEPPELLTGSKAYDIELDVPSGVPTLLDLLTRKRELSVGGVTVDWSGNRQIDIKDSKLIFTPAPSVELNKWLLRVRVQLKSITVTREGRQVRLELSGVPDLTINFN
jgi:hypothetical protein